MTLMESKLPSNLSQLNMLEDNLHKDPVESLLLFCGSVTELDWIYFLCLPDSCSQSSMLNFEKVCAICYLAGILELPKFWRLKAKEGIDIGKQLFGFFSLLYDNIFQLIQDMMPSGVDDSEDESPHWTSACFAVNTLASISSDSIVLVKHFPLVPLNYQALSPFLYSMCYWLEVFIFCILRNPRPKMERSFPKAFSVAPQVNEIFKLQHIPSPKQPQMPAVPNLPSQVDETLAESPRSAHN